MGPLENEVTKLVNQAFERDPMILRLSTGMDPGRPVSDQEMISAAFRAIGGLKEAVQRLAREIDEMREA